MDKGRQMGLAATIAVVTGESIALGIFLTPAAMARSLGSPVLLAAVWCGMGLMTMCGALCYSELAVHFPVTGGEYVYLREGFGGRIAFLFGWMSAAVMDPGLAAALAVGATPYVLALLGFSTIGFSPQSTIANPINAGKGSCIRTIKLIETQPARKITGAAGNHHRSTGSRRRKSEVTERAKKQTAEKIMNESIRSNAPKLSTSSASPVCSSTAFAGVPNRG